MGLVTSSARSLCSVQLLSANTDLTFSGSFNAAVTCGQKMSTNSTESKFHVGGRSKFDTGHEERLLRA